MKSSLSLGTLALAVSATTTAAGCFYAPVVAYVEVPCIGYVAVPYGYVLVHYVSPEPVHHLANLQHQQRHEKAHPRAPVRHIVKRRKQPHQEEKAPPVGPPPTLPAGTQASL